MDVQKFPLAAAYELAREYRNQARAMSCQVRAESQLKQYYTLISMAVRVLRYIKQVYALSIEQDAWVSFELVDLLLTETHNLDLAESYLSSLRERLFNHELSGFTGSLTSFRMHCELWLLYRVPSERNSRFHYKAALRGCEQLLKHLVELKDTYKAFEDWIQVFHYVSMSLNRKLGKHSIAKAQYANLIQMASGNVQWKAFLTLSHVNYLLGQRLPVSLSERQALGEILVQDVGPQWFAWKLLLELILQVYEDKNITENLTQFKSFFPEYKTALDSADHDYCVKVGEDLELSLTSFFLLNYKDMKNLLLLLQSVSYLVNCHDKKANFSIKFLAKVGSSARKTLEALDSRKDCSIREIEAKNLWYGEVLSFSRFYQIWLGLLLISDAPSPPNESLSNKHLSGLLTALLSHMGHKDDVSSVCQQYEDLASSSDVSNEVALISLINSYLIRSALISDDVDRQEQARICNFVWEKILKRYAESDMRNSTTLDCTLVMVWIMSHFEPFTSNPMPAAENDKNRYLERLRRYYLANKLSLEQDVPPATELDATEDKTHEGLDLKRGLMMQILLNYLGGRLFEQDLEIICQISAKCYRLARLQNLPVILYVIGVWHLTNCTLAMKTKEATIMSAKLQALERKLDNGGL